MYAYMITDWTCVCAHYTHQFKLLSFASNAPELNKKNLAVFTLFAAVHQHKAR